MSTGYAWNAALLGHSTPRIFPERAERVELLAPESVVRGLNKVEWVESAAPVWAGALTSAHTPEYVSEVRDAFKAGRRALDRGETLVLEDTAAVAESAVHLALQLTGAVVSGQLKNGFAALRPPGHHAGKCRAAGFCVYNNVAICARYAQHLGLSRVLIVDWDVHPGDGTAAIFYSDPSVHVVSLHQEGLFPKTVGAAEQTGRDDGLGSTYNVPLPAEISPTEYLQILDKTLLNAAFRCKPDIVFISSGFDAHGGDPVGGMSLRDDTFQQMLRTVSAVAAEYASSRLVWSSKVATRHICYNVW